MRGPDGYFLPGQSANPAGRPPGRQNVDQLMRDALEDHGAAYVATVLGKAFDGDYRFAELAVNRAYGTPVHRQIEITASAEMDRLVDIMRTSLGLPPTTDSAALPPPSADVQQDA